jgi:hypothetical protein
MNFTRGKRIALEVLGPPLLGGAAATLWAWGMMVYRNLYTIETFGAMAAQLSALPSLWLLYGVFAFPMMGVQAILYAAIMEWCFSRGLDPRSWRSVALSTGLGFASSAVIGFGYGYERKETWYFFNGFGLAVGFVLGWLIRRLSPKPGLNTG